MAKKTEPTPVKAEEVKQPEVQEPTPVKAEVVKPVLLDEAAEPEHVTKDGLVTIENELGVQHKVSSIVAKSLGSDPNIKIVK